MIEQTDRQTNRVTNNFVRHRLTCTKIVTEGQTNVTCDTLTITPLMSNVVKNQKKKKKKKKKKKGGGGGGKMKKKKFWLGFFD